MKFRFFLLAILGCVWGCQGHGSVVLSPTPSATNISQPRLVTVPKTEYDLGTIRQGEEAMHEFVVRNDGKGPLHFTQPASVQLGCCMAVKVTPETVPSGQKASIVVTYKTKLRPGPFRLGFELFPSDPTFPKEFTITGTVTSDLVVDPIQLSFDRAGKRQFVVQGSGLNVDYKITQVTTNSEHLTVSEDKATSGAQTRVYNVQWDGKPLRADVATAVYVMTDSELLTWFPVLVFTPTSQPGAPSGR